ncbi:unnamed protein product [Hymenolepis diminuta]|uniref:Uncharacterized protein n=1 Tax=Hymenolepis diminuta TaxID=6216 RepID=A0A564XYI7_HYMDI|nr:unnamed protein product [Hymenolepis diminuta]
MNNCQIVRNDMRPNFDKDDELHNGDTGGNPVTKELPPKEKRFWVDYRYEARFGIPTRRQPIPKHTVSVFFTLRKAHCKPKVSKLDVTYVIESLIQKHRPNEHVFNEEWLKIILESKANLGEKLCF